MKTICISIIMCIVSSCDDSDKLSKMKSPVIVISTNNKHDYPDILLRDGDGNFTNVFGQEYFTLNPGDTLK